MKTSLFFCLALMCFGVMASMPLGTNRKGVDGRYDQYGCMQSNDYYIVNFAAYQNQTSSAEANALPEAECTDLPNIGNTQISIDLLDLDVRKKPVALKIVDASGLTLSQLPMEVVKQGVLSTQIQFTQPGRYQAILTVDDRDLNTPPEVSALTIPIQVAVEQRLSKPERGLVWLGMVLAAVIGLIAVVLPRFVGERTTQ